MVLTVLVALSLAGDLPKDLAKSAGCAPKRPCVVKEERKAGPGADGVAQRVIQLARGEGERQPGGECIPEEHWLVRDTNPAAVRLALALCNDGYGASGVGEDAVTVKGNRLTHLQYGGSAWRWSSAREFQLSPPRPLSEASSSFHTMSPQLTEDVGWSWETFSGERVRHLPLCNDEGHPDLREESPAKAVSSTLIPQVTLPEAFRKEGWKTTALGDCAAKATFVIFGAKGRPEDSSLRVVASSPTELLVEVTDDTFTTNEKKWIAGDHLELWFADVGNSRESCVGRRGQRAVQWAIDLPSGRVRSAFGSTTANPDDDAMGQPAAEVAQAGKVVRVKVLFPAGEWKGVTLVYSDSDDGVKQERLLSTSQFLFGQAATVGELRVIPPARATCEVVGGSLVPKDLWTPPAEGALFAPAGP